MKPGTTVYHAPTYVTGWVVTKGACKLSAGLQDRLKLKMSHLFVKRRADSLQEWKYASGRHWAESMSHSPRPGQSSKIFSFSLN